MHLLPKSFVHLRLRVFLLAMFALIASLAVAANPQVPQGQSASFPPTGYDAPANTQTWDIVNSGNVIATKSQANGWSVSYSSSQFTVGAPAGAIAATNYEVRYKSSGTGGGLVSIALQPPVQTSFSAKFDVVLGPPSLSAIGGNGSVGLTWSTGIGVTASTVYRSTTNGGPYAQVSVNGINQSGYSTSATDANVVNGTTYYYVVTNSTSTSTSLYSNQASATPNGPPLAPTNLTATAGDTQVTLSWTASANTTSYIVKRGTTTGGPYTQVATGVTATSYTDSGLTDGTTYYYVVVASNSVGTSPNSNEANATPKASTNPPPAPTGLTAKPGDTQVSLSWTASSGASAYNVKRSTTTGGPYASVATGVTSATYIDAGLTDGVTYYYVVTATNAYGESQNSNEANATPEPTPPSPPTNLKAYPGNAQVTLTWLSSASATTYTVLRSTASGGPYSAVGNGVTATKFVDTGLSNGTTYYYVAVANNAGGASGYSNEAHATPTSALVPLGIIPNPPNGVLPNALSLPSWMEQTIPTDSSDAPAGGPSSVFSFNLPYGVVDLDTGRNVLMDDPNVGSIYFGVSYRTALAAGNVSSPGLPAGWTHNWDFRVVPLKSGAWGPLLFVYPNGASETITPDQPTGGSSLPPGTFQIPTGAPYVVTGVPDPNNLGQWLSITINHNGQTKEVFTLPSGDTSYRLTTAMIENGSSVGLTYSSGMLSTLQSSDPFGNVTTGKQISLYYSSGVLQSAWSDNTTVYYGYDANGELKSVSNQDGGGDMWDFSYATMGGASYVSSATTYGNRQAVVSYDPQTGRATGLTDGNGKLRNYTYSNNYSTQVTIGPLSSPTDQWNDVYDGIGRLTASTDAAGNTTAYAYSSSDPSALTSVTKQSGAAVTIQRDAHGNPTQYTYGPWFNSTKLTWDYPSGFPMGRITSIQEETTAAQSNRPPTSTTLQRTRERVPSQASSARSPILSAARCPIHTHRSETSQL